MAVQQGLVGSVLDVVCVDVEPGKIREFARATHAQDDAHTDAETASAAGFGALPATATHVVVAGHHRDQAGFVAALGLAIERVVVGSVDWEYARPLVAGDRITGTRRVVDDSTRQGKSGGTMRLVTLETQWVDQHGQTAVTQREVLIERGAK
ncbi:MaoC family dehydratase N-terminal domain-containing protein [Gordonia sp. zg691]|uniref:FAS1-like dehydratase domain-containing protein n=1 Tax=Gordonia jinghuaiqii TaxID=2758710 RepID=UPI001662773D|nr:MaoC family dehydratase N-terminal domain-containing protein [Gordonia jinghuaiqii]MBD0860312.1 MaoC family dehydratase N-terminal domain-containing protein [Gordonia jinghuaiqii]